jgi:putative DNA primase/helicase
MRQALHDLGLYDDEIARLTPHEIAVLLGPTGRVPATGPVGSTATSLSHLTGPTGPSGVAVNQKPPAGPTGSHPAHDWAMTTSFLTGLDACAKKFSVQFISDEVDVRDRIRRLTREEIRQAVEKWNTPERRLGVFVLPNGLANQRPLALFGEINGNNEQAARAWATMQVCKALPSMAVRYGGHLQFLYLCSELPPDQFLILQKRLNAKLGTDGPTGTELPRVRLPGTLVWENPNAPQLVKLCGDARIWQLDDLIGKLGLQGDPCDEAGDNPIAAAEPSPGIASDIDTRTAVVTFFPNEQAQSLRCADLTLPQLAEQIRSTTAPIKEALPWLKLAVFGDKRSRKNCLRTNANLVQITGIEVEHDKGEIAFDTVLATLRTAKLRALAYTSPSYEPVTKEKWRILLPTSGNLSPDLRAGLVARVNGLFGGKLAGESFTLSQAYFYGHAVDKPVPRVEVIDGDFIDLRSDLDSEAMDKDATYEQQPAAGGQHRADRAAPEGIDDTDIDDIRSAATAIPPSVLHDEPNWHIVARALAWQATIRPEWTETLFEILDVVSARPLAGTYDREENRLKFDGYIAAVGQREPSKTTTIRTFFMLARNHGWRGHPLPKSLRVLLHSQAGDPALLLRDFIDRALRQGVDENKIVEACVDGAYSDGAIHAHVRGNGGEEHVRKQIEEVLNVEQIMRRPKVLIRVTAGNLHEHWRDIQRELIDRQCPVYVRGNRLMQPVWRWEKAADGRKYLTARFETFNVHRMADMVSRNACRFEKFDKRAKVKWVVTDPPDKLIERLIEVHDWKFPTVVGLINSPTMRPDGSMLDKQGYDPATQLWYRDSGDVTLPPMPDEPSKDDATKALALLNSLLDEFPFDKDKEQGGHSVARSVALAYIMTTVLRGAITGAVPLFLFTATEPRSGKTYLVILGGVIATGHEPIPTAGHEKREEMEKRIETAALSGRLVMHLNNLPNGMTVESEALAMLSTEGRVLIRTLGRHAEGLCDCRGTTVALNGNNTNVAADLVPRTCYCRLDPQLEHTESRTFRGDPVANVRADRGKYLAAIFTIARAFMAAGSPRQPHKVVAGFEAWSRLIQQSLIWLGETDPHSGMDELKALDPVQGELQTLMDLLSEYFADDEEFTIAAFKQEYDQRYHQTTLGPYGKFINSKAIGRLFLKHRGRIFKGLKFTLVSEEKARVCTYKLVRDPASPFADIDVATSANTDNALASFLNTFIDRKLITDRKFVSSEQAIELIQHPNGWSTQIVYQIMRDDRLLVVPKRAFLEHLTAKKFEARLILAGLKKFYDAREARMALGAGTTYAHAQELCIVMQASEEILEGLVLSQGRL